MVNKILKYTIWTGLYLTLLIPFIVFNNTFFPYITGKAFTFRIIVEILLGLWLILIIKDEEFRPKWSWILGAAGLFTFILLIADINAVAPYKAFWSNFERMEGWVTFIHLLAYFTVLGSMFNKEKLWLWFLRTNILAGVILAVTSIDKAADVRFSGPLGNPIYIAVYFLFLFFFTLILLYKDVLVKNLTNWTVFRKVFANVLLYVYLIASVLSLFVVYRTSRGALLGAIGGIFVATILIGIFEREKKVIRHISLGGIVAVITVVIVFIGMRDTLVVKNNPTLSRLAEISWSNVNGQARQLIWPMALKGFQEKPILGWGQEGFNYVFNKYYDPAMYGQESWFDRAHNAPLDFLVAGGILGLLSYLALFGSALYLLWLRRNNLSITERALLTGLFAGYLFQAIFIFDNLISYVLFFTTLAYVHSRIVEDEKRKPVFSFLSNFVSNEEYQNYILIPIVVIVTAVGVYLINIPGIQANKTLINGLILIQKGQVLPSIEALKLALSYKTMGDAEIREQLISLTPSVLKANSVDQKTKQDFLNLTFNEVENQIAIVPDDALYYILAGSLLNGIGNSEEALSYIKKAIDLSPKKQGMRFELVQALYALGSSTEAMKEAKSAYELDKRYDQAKQVYKATIQNEIKANPQFKAEGAKILNDLGVK
ncbi:MAG: O-antigen ligase family protein [bacterium]